MSVQRRPRIPLSLEGALMRETVKVAFATTDRQHVDQPVGSSESLAIYAIDPEQTTLVEIARFGEPHEGGHEDKLAAKLALLEGCVAVYCIAVGDSAIRQLLARGIQPVRVDDGAMIDPLLRELETALRQGSSPWLGRAIQRRQGMSSDRFQAMEAEGWQE